MPRLRQATVAKKEELFDSKQLEKPVDKEPEPKEPQLEAAADDEPEPEVVIEEPKKKEEPKQDDAALALKREIEKVRQSEAAIKQAVEERDKAIREHQEKYLKSQREVIDREELALDSTIKAAKADAEKAMLDYKNALDIGDNAAAAEAMDRALDAKSSMRAFERDREMVKERKRELKKERKKVEEQLESKPQKQPQTVNDLIDTWKLPQEEDAWMRANPQYITDQAKSSALNTAVTYAKNKGYNPGDGRFLPEVKAILSRIEDEPSSQQQAEPERQTSIVSAPVSREVPSTGSGQRQTGRITLTQAQLEAARIAGITPAEYARNLVKFNEMKANGEYGDRR